ncbi:MAG: hypothetical protein ACKO5R_03545 [Planctomycetaceae bacterium]
MPRRRPPSLAAVLAAIGLLPAAVVMPPAAAQPPAAPAQPPAARFPVPAAPIQRPAAPAAAQAPAPAPAAPAAGFRTQPPAAVPAVPARPVAPAAAPAAAAPPAGRTVAVTMEDQFRTKHDTGALRGDVIVLLFADRNGAEAAHEVGKRLHVHFHPGAAKVDGPDWLRQPVIGIPGWPEGTRVPNVHSVAIACLPEIPRAVHPVVRSQIRKESPHVPVWIDFTGIMPRTFGMAPEVPNILLIDTFGRPQGVLSGEIDEAKYQQLVAAIERLRREGQGVRTAAATEAPAGR